MTVERLKVEVLTPSQTSQTQPQMSQQTVTQPPKVNITANLVSVFGAIAAILAVRLFLLLSVIGAFTVAFMAIPLSDSHSLWVLGIYCVFTIVPLVFLDIKTRNRS